MKKILSLCIFFGMASSSFAQVTSRLVHDGFILNPPPVPTAHASTITELPNGDMLAAWFGGTEERAKDVCIYTAVFSKGKWSKPVNVANGIINSKTRYATWNPVLFHTRAGKLILFYKIGPSPSEWWGAMKYSKDNGRTWSKEELLPKGFLGPVRNKPIQLANGNLLHPSSTESLDNKKWEIHMEISDSTGHNWRKIAIDCDTFGVIQPSILIHPNNRLQLVCRSRQNAIVETWSDDQGETWSPLRKQVTMNPNSGIDAVTTASGLHVLVYNPTKKGGEWSDGRNILRVATSTDGQHWSDVYELEKHPDGEYSYPAIIQSRDGLLHITYTYDRKNIKYVSLELK
ncbi:sialidase family protein [Chitinophaga sp. MM2321]|uniref:sialidase family protein n=1 Tax=Chitinophaga sp. MM2321 TaxID=3137178 RepID=UPI0032D5A57C